MLRLSTTENIADEKVVLNDDSDSDGVVVVANNGEDDDEDDEDSDDDDLNGEKRLENLVFGSGKNIFKSIEKNKTKATNKKRKNEQIAESLEKRKAVWIDEDDDQMINIEKFDKLSNKIGPKKTNLMTTNELEETLKAKFSKYYGTPVWADLDTKKSKKGDDEDGDSDSEMFHHTGNFLTKSQYLPKSVLDIKKCTDANKEAPHTARLKCVEFHPNARVLLTAGLNQTLTLFQIDGKKNSKIQSIFLDKFPILNAHFNKTGDEIIMGSRHKTFFYYDMMAGKIVNVPANKALGENRMASFEISPNNAYIAFIGSYGQVHLFSARSKEWIDTLKVNDTVNAITFSSDSKYLFTYGDAKDVHIFDLDARTHECVHRFNDFGCLSGQSIAITNNLQYLATGDKSGVVNIYNYTDLTKSQNPKPVKSFMNLTTPCTTLKFNCTGEILAACSSHAENAFKLIHVPSLTVFSNFPNKLEKLRIPLAIDFSLNSGYLSIGNHKGSALLYRLKHYGSY